MLDSVTKKLIDDLRNILVGKIPSPQSQVEQITTGLIYKFMYDMDAEAMAFEGSVAVSGLEAYINGSDTNKLQHVGGEYTMNVAGAELSAGVDYDTDAKDWTPTAGLSFNF